MNSEYKENLIIQVMKLGEFGRSLTMAQRRAKAVEWCEKNLVRWSEIK